jgi:aspartate aminotransferase-like enzyme
MQYSMQKQLLFLPGPVTVAQPVLAAQARPLINHRSKAFASLLERIVEGLRPAFGTRGEVVLLGSSGTGALEAAVANLFSPGEMLLSCAIGAFGERFAAIARAYGCSVEALDTPLGAALDPQALEHRLAADTRRRIAGVLLTHNETSTGVANDMAALAPALCGHGAITLVDSVSGLGASEFRMDAWGYDVVVTASQKAFAASPGAAMVAVSDRAWKRIADAHLPRFYFDLARARKAARDGETPWTPPISILYGLEEALRRYHAEGAHAAYARHGRYAAAVRAALEALGFTIFSRPSAHSPTVVTAYPPSEAGAKALLDLLRERYGIVLAGGQGELAGKIVRFGTMGDISEGDLLGAIGAIELALLDLGATIDPGAGTSAAIEALAARITSGVA